jgi:hypothetical protein
MSDSEDGKEGKAKVRDLLIQRVAEAGLVRAKGVSADMHDAYLKRLESQLAYMSAENLMTLSELVIENGQGPSRTVWPSEVIVMNFARALQAPPPAQRRIISSWLASVEGPVAEAGGYLVELYRFLAKHGRPPMQMDNREMREAARDNNRRCDLIADRIDRGTVTEDDRDWLARYREDERAARQIVDEGARRRAAQGKGEAA